MILSRLVLAVGLCCVLVWVVSGCGVAAPPPEQAATRSEGATGEPPLVLRVVDPSGAPVAGALVFLGGCASNADACQPQFTDQHGLLQVGPSDVLTQPVALALQETRAAGQAALCCQSDHWLRCPIGERPPCSTSHGSWSYRVYLTNLVWSGEGDPQSVWLRQDGVVELVLQQLHPLILFDIKVSLDWQASESYVSTLKTALGSASDYLFDLTDGQMAFQQILVYDNSQHWDEADIRVHRINTVCPYSPIGVMTGKADRGSIDLGPYWDGGYVSGDWSAPNGYRTIAHEFMHFALGLYDEYLDAQGEKGAHCPHPKDQLCAESDAAKAASAMFHEECATELSAIEVDPLWSEDCKDTRQWHCTGQSAWETIEASYGDCGQQPPRWQIDTPMRRQRVMAGPDPTAGQWPEALPGWPEVDTQNAGAGQDLTIRLTAPNRCTGETATVTLYPGGVGPGKGLGEASLDAEFTLLGAQPGDVICAKAQKGWEAACAATYRIPDTASDVTQAISLSAKACTDISHVHAVAPLPRAQTGNLWYPQAGDLGSYEPGRINVAAIDSEWVSPLWSYNQVDGAAGLAGLLQTIRLPDELLGSVHQGQLLAVDPTQSTFATVAGRSLGDYALLSFEPGQAGELVSADGRVSLLVEADAARAADSIAIIFQPQQPPTVPLPETVRTQGDIAFVAETGLNDRPESHAVLRFNCLPRPASAVRPPNYALLRYDDRTRQWQTQPATLIAAANMLTAQINQPGYYVFVEMED